MGERECVCVGLQESGKKDVGVEVRGVRGCVCVCVCVRTRGVCGAKRLRKGSEREDKRTRPSEGTGQVRGGGVGGGGTRR